MADTSTDESFATAFERFCAACFGVADPSELPVVQRLQLEDAFFCGAKHGFYSGYGALDEEAIALAAELEEFGQHIVARYAANGLPLGQRRS